MKKTFDVKVQVLLKNTFPIERHTFTLNFMVFQCKVSIFYKTSQMRVIHKRHTYYILGSDIFKE